MVDSLAKMVVRCVLSLLCFSFSDGPSAPVFRCSGVPDVFQAPSPPNRVESLFKIRLAPPSSEDRLSSAPLHPVPGTVLLCFSDDSPVEPSPWFALGRVVSNPRFLRGCSFFGAVIPPCVCVVLGGFFFLPPIFPGAAFDPKDEREVTPIFMLFFNPASPVFQFGLHQVHFEQFSGACGFFSFLDPTLIFFFTCSSVQREVNAPSTFRFWVRKQCRLCESGCVAFFIFPPARRPSTCTRKPDAVSRSLPSFCQARFPDVRFPPRKGNGTFFFFLTFHPREEVNFFPLNKFRDPCPHTFRTL